jgi:polyphosphate kinase 2 (PPK2 family)
MLDTFDLSQKIKEKKYERQMPELGERLYKAQIASLEANLPVILLFEGWKTAGTGKILRDITAYLDPRGFKLHPFRAAGAHDRKYPWMRRFWLNLPAYGEWGIYDHSWYWRVLTERVDKLIPEKEWRRAYREIVNFERALANDGNLILKFFLHINKRQQNRRLEKQSKKRSKRKRVTSRDWEHHCRYNDWLVAYEEMFEHTDTKWGPWTLVASKDQRYASISVIQTILGTLERRLDIVPETIVTTTMAESELTASKDQVVDTAEEEIEPAKETIEEPDTSSEHTLESQPEVEPISVEELVVEQSTA